MAFVFYMKSRVAIGHLYWNVLKYWYRSKKTYYKIVAKKTFCLHLYYMYLFVKKIRKKMLFSSEEEKNSKANKKTSWWPIAQNVLHKNSHLFLSCKNKHRENNCERDKMKNCFKVNLHKKCTCVENRAYNC